MDLFNILGYSTLVSASIMAITGFVMSYKDKGNKGTEEESMALTWVFMGFMVLSILLFCATFSLPWFLG